MGGNLRMVRKLGHDRRKGDSARATASTISNSPAGCRIARFGVSHGAADHGGLPVDIAGVMDFLGEDVTVALAGLFVGAVFGVAAQRSRFCLRAAVVEFDRGSLGPKVSVWLLTFATALMWTQAASQSGLISLADARMLAATGLISGAMLGGLLFGAGMVLGRGCSGRLLVLAATGNLRAQIARLVFAVVAQVSLHGWLAPLRDWLAALWVTLGGANVQLLEALGLPDRTGIFLGLAFTILALVIAWRNRVG
jgi:uncharacterized membrane protein YedE/YeeE